MSPVLLLIALGASGAVPKQAAAGAAPDKTYDPLETFAPLTLPEPSTTIETSSPTLWSPTFGPKTLVTLCL